MDRATGEAERVRALHQQLERGARARRRQLGEDVEVGVALVSIGTVARELMSRTAEVTCCDGITEPLPRCHDGQPSHRMPHHAA